MKQVINLLTILFLSIPAFSQQVIPCASDEYLNEMLSKQPMLLQAQDRFYDEVSRDITETGKNYKKGTVRIIPVVFHVIHAYGDENISKAQIEDQMRVLNEDFRRLNADASKTRSQFAARSVDMEIEFRLARKDPNGNCTDGITRTYSELTDGGDEAVKNLIRWDYRKYLNIWIIKRIARDASGEGIILGYATLPYATSSSTDGIVMISSRVGTIGTSSVGNAGRVLTHEIGHWLGLLHPFQDGCGSNCSTTGDRVCDTPPVANPSFGCPTTNNTCSNDAPNELDMVENYMDYANGSCQNAFTAGQKAIVNSALANNNYRAQNISTTTHTATGIFTTTTCGPKSDFHTTSRKTIVCEGGSLTFEDLSWNGTVTDRTWTFEGGSPSVSTIGSPSVTYNKAGIYKVTLLVSNTDGNNTLTKTNFITVLPAVSDIKTPYTEDFENSTLFTKEWQIIENDNTNGWKRNTTTSFAGTACIQAYIDANTTANSRYNIYSPVIDLSTLGISNPVLSFKAAYSAADASKSELLVIHASVDCGNTWKSIAGYRSNTGLASVSGVNAGWTPKSAADWKTQTADLSAYSTVKNLMLRFEVVSQSGNSIFIDDINIARYAVGVPQVITDNDFNVYPNPSNGNISISFLQANVQDVTLKLIDSRGVTVKTLINSANRQTIEMDGLAEGVYYLHVFNEAFSLNKKIIVFRK